MTAQPGTSHPRSTSKQTAWQALEHHHKTMQGLHLRKLFADDPKREQLGAGEDRDDRSQKGEARYGIALDEQTDDHVHERQ